MSQVQDRAAALMTPQADFLAPRRSFLPPIRELDAAADLLAAAADALLAGDHDLARQRLRQADMPAVHAYASRIMGRLDREVHRHRVVPGSATLAVKAGPRMPSATTARAIFRRDGFRCRFCGCRVALAAARDRMREQVPDAIRWGSTNREQHAAFFALTATLDHVVPHAAGGGSEADNIVTACRPCNFGRGSALLAEMGLSDPRQHPPLVDGWDGLDRMLQPRPAGPVVPRTQADALSREDWFAALERAQPSAASRLSAFLDECRDLPVQWRLRKVLVANMASREGALSVLGIAPTGLVEVPWSIGGYKDEFRAFAQTLAEAVPGARVYETPRTWCVKVAGRKVSVSELLDAAGALRTAFTAFGQAIAARDKRQHPNDLRHGRA